MHATTEKRKAEGGKTQGPGEREITREMDKQ